MHILAWVDLANETLCWSMRCLPHSLQLASQGVNSPVFPHPWAKVAADPCSLSGQILLVVADYFSNFIEVDSLSTETFKAVI